MILPYFPIYFNGYFCQFLTFDVEFELFILPIPAPAPLRHDFGLFQHGLGENSVTACRVVDKDMGHCAHQPPILYDGAATHPLHDAARLGQKAGSVTRRTMFRLASASLIRSIWTR